MKFRWDKRYLGWGLTAFAVIVASFIIVAILLFRNELAAGIGNLLNSIISIFYGLIFAYLLCPVVNFFDTRVFGKIFKIKNSRGEHELGLKVFVKNKLSRILSIIVTIAITLLVIIGVISAILPQLETTINILVNNIPTYVSTLTKWVGSTLSSFPELSAEITEIVNQSFAALRTFLTSSILPQVGDYLGFVTNGIMSVIGFLMNLLLGLVISVYCLYSKELFSAQAKKLLYATMKVKHANHFIASARKVHHSFGSFLTGTLIDSFVVACITFIITTIFNIPFALLVSVIMGITNIIPYFGPFIGAIPSAFLILMEDPFKCVIFIIIILVIQNLNGNVLSPRILGESIGLSGFWVIFAILAGQGLFGFWGMIIGIPVFAVVYSTVRTLIADRLGQKGLPSDSDSYTDIMCFEAETLEPVSLSSTLEENRRQEEERERRLEEEKRKARLERRKRLEETIERNKKNKK